MPAVPITRQLPNRSPCQEVIKLPFASVVDHSRYEWGLSNNGPNLFAVDTQLNADWTESMRARDFAVAPSTSVYYNQGWTQDQSANVYSPLFSCLQHCVVLIEFDPLVQSRVQWSAASRVGAQRQTRSASQSLPLTTLDTTVVSLVSTRLDFGDATLSGISGNLVVSKPCRMTLLGQTPVFPARRTSPCRSSDCSSFVPHRSWNSSIRRWILIIFVAHLPPLLVRATDSCRWLSYSSAPSYIRYRHSLLVHSTRLVTHCGSSSVSVCNSGTVGRTASKSSAPYCGQLITDLFRVSYPAY